LTSKYGLSTPLKKKKSTQKNQIKNKKIHANKIKSNALFARLAPGPSSSTGLHHAGRIFPRTDRVLRVAPTLVEHGAAVLEDVLYELVSEVARETSAEAVTQAVTGTGQAWQPLSP
jgi:hypothetical protein